MNRTSTRAQLLALTLSLCLTGLAPVPRQVHAEEHGAGTAQLQLVEVFEAAEQLDTTPGSADTLRYEADLALDRALSRGALDAVYNGADGLAGTADDADAILASANSFAATPAKAGYPSITVPGGFVPATPPIENPFPSGVTFTGPAFSEPVLIGLAYAFEQATHHRQPPASTPPLLTDSVFRP